MTRPSKKTVVCTLEIANKPKANGLVYTKEALMQAAEKAPCLQFDEDTGSLMAYGVITRQHKETRNE